MYLLPSLGYRQVEISLTLWTALGINGVYTGVHGYWSVAHETTTVTN